MTRPRRELVSLDTTPFYHCVSRCVRRAFLCGDDTLSGQNFEHRRQWILDRIILLSEIFAIEVAAYAIMSNHYHLVVRIDRDRALNWERAELIERWYRLFAGHTLVDRFLVGESLSAAERDAADVLVDTWRERLYDLGWFMRCLNEHIARLANAEDGCTGRFWAAPAHPVPAAFVHPCTAEAVSSARPCLTRQPCSPAWRMWIWI